MLLLALGEPASPLFHNVNWLWFTLFVGANLFQSGLTQWCLKDKILAKLVVPVVALLSTAQSNSHRLDKCREGQPPAIFCPFEWTGLHELWHGLD